MTTEISCIEDESVLFSYQELKNDVLLDYARNRLPLSGQLEYNEHEAYCYLKVHDDFIEKLFPLLGYKDAKVPEYFPPRHVCGAHISLVYPEEDHAIEIKSYIIEKKLENKVFHFKIIKFVKVSMGRKIFFTLIISCPELEELRTLHGLSPTLTYQKFSVPLHITIGIIENSEK